MMTCETCRSLVLDHAHDLLDPEPAALFTAHLGTCLECAAYREKTLGLISHAAKSSFPNITFDPNRPIASRREMVETTARSKWISWTIAASLFLAFCAYGSRGFVDLVGTALNRSTLDEAYAKMRAADAEIKITQRRIDDARIVAQAKVNTERQAHDALAQKWIADEGTLAKQIAKRPFQLEVDGPTTATPGAPNEYRVQAKALNTNIPKTVKYQAVVKDADGRTLHTTTAEAASTTLKLPASLWTMLKPGSEPTLYITATDSTGGATSTVTEKIRLTEPLFTTFLSTDKPLYRPGETLYYRSLTLDRTTFQPIRRELNLRFALYAPDGQAVSGSETVGLAKPTLDGSQFILGPDGEPIRGLGTGSYKLPTRLPGGEYTLKVFEVPTGTQYPLPGAKPLGERKVLVNQYTPERLEKSLEFDGKSYGLGETVSAKFTVLDQTKPAANAEIKFRLTTQMNGETKSSDIDKSPTKTDANGAASVQFTLPKVVASDVSLTVSVRFGGVTESIVRRVPLIDKKLIVEFFPEGGTLVAGVLNRVYFRATTRTGQPADMTGLLSDGKTRLQTLTDADKPGVNQGMGVFSFTPMLGQKYHVTLDKPANIEAPLIEGLARGFALPEVQPAGVTLTIRDGVSKPGEPIRLQLASQGSTRKVVIGAYIRGRAMTHATAILKPGEVKDVSLDLGTSPLGGVTRVTVFEEVEANEGRSELKPLAERLVFRTPGEVLKLSATPQQAGAYLPGAPVELTISATDERGQPKPAIIWAAVVNKSVLAMADDKTLRMMPTHFLLNGELEKPESLENADFLLTDHPLAATALDLVLGTQGWRRFAEQAPAEFRTQKPSEDTERLLMAMGANNSKMLGMRAESVKLFDQYWPQYEAASAKLEAAESEVNNGEYAKPFEKDLQMASSERMTQSSKVQVTGQEFWAYQESIDQRHRWLPFNAIILFTTAVVLFLVRVRVANHRRERVWLLRGIIGFAGFAIFLFVVSALTYSPDTSWKSMIDLPQPYGTFQGVGSATRSKMMTVSGGNAPAPVTPPFAREARTKGLTSPTPKPKSVMLPKAIRDRGTLDTPVGVPVSTLRENKPQVPRLNPGQRFNDGTASRLNLDGTEWQAYNLIRASLPANPSLVVREYAHARVAPAEDGTRKDFTETLLWQPVLVLPDDGRGLVKFDLAEDVTAYQVLVAGHTLDGRLGASVTSLEVRKPLVVNPKLPQEISSADKLSIPVTVTNGTKGNLTADIAVSVDGGIIEGREKFSTTVPAQNGTRTLVNITPAKPEGIIKFQVSANAGTDLTDRIERTMTVVPDGFPVQGATNDVLEKTTKFPIQLPNTWIPGTMKAHVVVYPNMLSELQSGLEGMLREPYGCFEQTSTTNYPNVLVMDYLRETGQTLPDVASRARGLMDRGYSRLTSYECAKTGQSGRLGFEWFGTTDRQHEALSAYGLVQFTDMSRVYPVDPAMLDRTKKYLLAQRTGTGGFQQPKVASHAFGRAAPSIVDAYITWALTEAERLAGPPTDLNKELDALVALATNADGAEAKDAYFLAVVANALLNRNRTDDGVKLLQKLATMQTPAGDIAGASSSITLSTGSSLAIETTAFTVLGWLKVNRPEVFGVPVQKAMGWIGSQRSAYGNFGSTQSTILALKALIEHARINKKPAESGTLKVFLNDRLLTTKDLSNRDSGPIVVELPEANLQSGTIRIETTTKESYPVSLTWNARTTQPNSSGECPLALTTKFDRTTANEGETVRLTATLTNLRDAKQGMSMAILGLPAGLKLPEDMKQLKALTEQPVDGTEPVVSYFELRGREVILYRRGMMPKEVLNLTLDLIAETPGQTRGPASRAYLYYGPEHKQWLTPLAIDIQERARSVSE
jgi:alpha-2-macroglobulin-like protein